MVETSLPKASYIFNETNDFNGRLKVKVVVGLNGFGKFWHRAYLFGT
jgi:hypothetical protein